jgi:hypothetical protein
LAIDSLRQTSTIAKILAVTDEVIVSDIVDAVGAGELLVQTTMQLQGSDARSFIRFLAHRARKVLVRRQIARLCGRPEWFPLGSVRFGDLRRLSPFSRCWGLDRGTPVDRYYIERFLAKNADDIRGRVLEIADNTYTLRFGGAQVRQSDILHVDATT